jgi:hypothetical protein
MPGKESRAPLLGRSLVREAWAVLLPAAIGVGLFLFLPRDSRSQAEAPGARPKGDPAVLCGGWHRGTGETVPLDLERVKRAYQGLKTRLARTLEAPRPGATIDLKKPYDTGLPACREDRVRTEPLSREFGTRFRGRALYFAAVPAPGRLALPSEVEQDSRVEILVLRAGSLGDLPKIANALGRPIGLGTAEFAKALGVRCVNTWIKISEKGDAVDLHEVR